MTLGRGAEVAAVVLNLRDAPSRNGEEAGSGPAQRPYWWDGVPAPVGAENGLPARVDVAIVGSGITGLSAARRLQAGGASVAVLDTRGIAAGASSRNFGMLGRQYVHPYRSLVMRMGVEKARRLFDCCNTAFDFVNDLIDQERIDCTRQPSGRLVTCATSRQLETLARELELRAEHFGHSHRMLDRQGLAEVIASPWYEGGAILPEHRCIHPGNFIFALARNLAARGVTMLPDTEVRHFARSGDGWELTTARGMLRARDLVVATNGYTGAASPWLQRRIVPIPAYMIATVPLQPDVLACALPGGRPWHDSARDMVYARLSPDGTRLLFGAATGEAHSDLSRLAATLRTRMLKLFPDLPRDVPLSHVWTGRCAGTFDLFPHAGRIEGLHFALGYCFGAGMPFGAWLGDGIGRRILGEGMTDPITEMAVPTLPLYRGRPWFMPVYLAWRKLLDRREGARVGV